MKIFLSIFLILLSAFCFADNLSYITNGLNNKINYNIYNESGQTIIEETRLDNKNPKIKFIDNYAEKYASFDINKLGNYIDTLYENDDFCIKRYELTKEFKNETDYNKFRKLVQITVQDKKTKEENIVFYNINVLPNNIDYQKYISAYISKRDIYIILQDLSRIYVYVINNNKPKDNRIIKKYYIPITVIDGINIESVDYISNNIIKININNKFKQCKQTEIWKLSQSEEYIISSGTADLKIDKEEIYLKKLLWTDYNDDIRYLSFDYFNKDTEPTIEQLKEKFPNDTFFVEEFEGEIKSSINTGDNTKLCILQKITFWCKNIILKFIV